MTPNNIIKQLSKGLALTFLISAFVTFLAVEVYNSKLSQSSEGGQFVTIMALSGIFWSFILSVFSATVLLNLYPQIRNNSFNSFLSFYLSPLVFSVVVAVDKVGADQLANFLTMTVPFFLVHTYFFIRFSSAVLNSN